MTLFQTMSNFFENDDDVFTGKDHTPLREDAFVKTPEEKIKIIEEKFAEIMHTLGLDMTDDSLKDSPKRVAKMYVNEIFGVFYCLIIIDIGFGSQEKIKIV